MKNIKKSMLLALVGVAACTMSSCKKKKTPGEVEFWSSFGATYTNALNQIVGLAKEKTGYSIKHISKNSYPEIKRAMLSAINVDKMPNIAMGYPDHFAEYLGNDALLPLEDYIKGDLRNDYYSSYLDENWFHTMGETHLYGVPFNKSTEVLGYNGTFVSYCASLPGYEDLGTVPQTWSEWESKGPRYMEIYKDLMNNKKILFGEQHVDGSTKKFNARTDKNNCHINENGDLQENGTDRIALLDFSEFKENDVNTARLMSWDACDNAFITLIKQWGAEYTRLDQSQWAQHPFYQKGEIKFANKENLKKVVDCLRFFNKLAKDNIFGVPEQLNGNFSSDAFANGSVMFMICSSGGLSYNTKTWHSKFTVAPIPYKDPDKKFVISQGANICMTDSGNEEESLAVIKELTTGDTQVEWCLATGYYPCSVSAATSEKYTDFLTEATDAGINKYLSTHPNVTRDQRLKEVYSKPSRVAYREGSQVNNDHYMSSTENWHKFVDAAFYGSSGVREAVEKTFGIVFRQVNADAGDQAYIDVINTILNDTSITNNTDNILIDRN